MVALMGGGVGMARMGMLTAADGSVDTPLDTPLGEAQESTAR